jgi:hypothetical protein
MTTSIAPWLTVDNAEKAIAFYKMRLVRLKPIGSKYPMVEDLL